VEDFVKEKKILDDIQSAGVKNDHLIRHLAFCDEVHCLVFPWADGGDLGQFWQRKCSRTTDDFLWSLGQLAGLASALEDLHKVNCRHGDLKPANILYFTEKSVGILKIADFGISRVHTIATGLRNGVTITSHSTRGYEGPETLEVYKKQWARSRLYDCWSMGCIILEFVVWLLYDFKALESFVGFRDPPDLGYYRHLKYNLENGESREEAVVHPYVDKAMICLREDQRCKGTALEALVNTVDNDLLKIDPKQRLPAADLHRRLRMIFEDAQKDPSYVVNVDVPRQVTPYIFSQEPLSDSSPKSTYQKSTS